MNGLICFFDILGYQSFLENNSASETASDTALKVLDIITTTVPEVKDRLSSMFINLPDDLQHHKQIFDEIRPLIFSDTILLSVQYPKTETLQNASVAHFSALAQIIFVKMFLAGLPMRGVILDGDFIIKDYCFAGTSIVKAYKLCQQLDFAGLVFQPEGALSPTKAIPLKLSEPNCISYLCPLKNRLEKKLTLLNWLYYLNPTEYKNMQADVEGFVHRSFWAHNKDCALETDEKLANTIKICRRLAIALEQASQD